MATKKKHRKRKPAAKSEKNEIVKLLFWNVFSDILSWFAIELIKRLLGW